MKFYKLEPREYDTLAGIADGFTPPTTDPVILAKTIEGEVTGRIVLMRPFHLEGTWVKPEFRGTGLALRLVRRAEQELLSMGVKLSLAYSPSEEVTGYLKRFGYEIVPLTILKKEL